ncbi:Intracellular distribution of mitochondria [Agyrium rufum]|nr:Intracellular distribution of mitochondria [Agyrium rufum]
MEQLRKQKNGDSKSGASEEAKEEEAPEIFQINVKLPHQPYEIKVMVSTQEQVQDLRQSIVELRDTFQYSCFHLEHNSERINDFVELSEVKGLVAESEIKLVEDPYTEKEARVHMVRVRDLIGAAGDRVDTVHGICAGLSLHEYIAPYNGSESGTKSSQKNSSELPHPLADYDFNAPAPISALLPPPPTQQPKTVKALSVSVWNPPPPSLRQKGHLLYLQLTTNEGEQHQITGHVSGFFVNKSSNSKFDPFPRPAPKNASAHSLLSLISKLSPSFESSFISLQEFNGRKDPLCNIQFTNAIPSNPWFVPASEAALSAHQPDMTRTQETYLIAGIENAETLRDWNEEFQSTRELPRENVQDRVFRERLTSKLFLDYNEAAVRGAIMVARGEVAPLNPTEVKEAQIFVYNNIFFSFGADGVGTYKSEGADEAARVAVGKDVAGVRVVNQLDIQGLFTSGTVIVDYLGKRIVCQSIVPGIFKQRDPGENQIDYGGVEGREVVGEDERFVDVFAKLSKALKVKKHDVWDKEGVKHNLEASVETKGLMGTDARKYALDLYRLTPLDILWIEQYWSEMPEDASVEKDNERDYPHRMAILRPELIEAYWRLKMNDYVKEQVKNRTQKASNGINGTKASTEKPLESNETFPENTEPAVDSEESSKSNEASLEKSKPAVDGEDANAESGKAVESGEQPERIDVSGFDLAFNTDVFCYQEPQTDEEKEQYLKDEEEVRAICQYLRETILTDLIRDLRESEVGFPMDGQSLTRLLHKRGINMRYLGHLASLSQKEDFRLEALHTLTQQEMVSRAFKHEANKYLKNVPVLFASACLSHLLNCLLGFEFNKSPKVQLDEEIHFLYPDADLSFQKVTPESMKMALKTHVRRRFRHDLDGEWFTQINHLPLLRDIALKLGIQLIAKDYQFNAVVQQPAKEGEVMINGTSESPKLNGTQVNGSAKSKKKRKNADPESRSSSPDSLVHSSPTTFEPDDIVNIVPVVKDACPKSTLADEALEAGKISMMQNHKELGQELLLESLSLHEQIYGVLHPEVARVYHQLSMLYYQMDEKTAAVELAHKAVIVSERTLGVDSNETILSYLNLALFEHANSNTSCALIYIRHALDLWKIIFGQRANVPHPDSITTLNNAAVMLQHLKHYHDSRIWFETSLAICEKVSGKSSVNTATLCFQLAQALALDQDAKGAVQRMREAYSIFHAKLGPDDRNTKESESWLEQLTQNAVSIAKHAKDVQARRLRRIQLMPKVTLGTRPQPSVGQANADVGMGRGVDAPRGGNATAQVPPHSIGGMDSRSVDELMKFIEGGGDAMKKGRSAEAKQRSARGNPKRRGGRSSISGAA